MYNLNDTAKNALNNYINFNDKKLHSIPYFYAFFDENGAFASHSEWDFGDATGRYLDALLLCDDISKNKDAEKTAKEYYEAIKWFISLGTGKKAEGVCFRPEGYEFCSPCVNTFDIRSALLGLASYYNKTNDSEAVQIIKNMINGMKNIGVDRGDYFYLPYAYYTDELVIENKEYDIKTNKADPCHYGGGVHIQPLMLCYHITKDKEILELCGKIVNFMVNKSGTFEDDGSFFVCGYFAGEDGHFHSRVSTVLGVLMYAVETNDTELIKWCDKVYKFARSQGTSYGFFPEGLGKRPENNRPEEYPDVARHTEICGTTDMIELALLFSENGYDYYSHAEKYANQLIKSQFLNTSGFVKREETDNESCSYKDIPERYKGAFLGRILANDLLNHGRYDNMGCCAAAGGRGIWALWKNAVVYENRETTVNLWLNCENNHGKIHFDIQNDTGKLTVSVKNKGTLKIRLPEFANFTDFKEYKQENDFLIFPDVEPNGEITLNFKCSPAEKKEILCGEELTIIWQGNIVKDVLPRGKNIPLYKGEI